MIFLLLLGAGKGERLNQSLPKAFVKIGGKELFLYSIEKFYKFVDKIFLALPEDYVEKGKELLKDKFTNVSVVAGGEKRQDSVFNCLNLIDDGIVLIHDVARPFVSEDLIKKVIEGVKKYNACIPVLEMVDTVKEIEGDFVKETLDREKIFIVQTPQGFRTKIIKEAYKRGKEEKIDGSDDSFFVEKFTNEKIYCVKGERKNIKITYPDDLIFAEFLLKKWEKE